MNDLSDIGSALVARRIALGMPQRELGDLLGVKQPQIARWEAVGYRTTSLERVAAVADALGVAMTTNTTADQHAAETTAAYVAVLKGSDPSAVAAVARTGAPPAAITAFCRLHHIERMDLFGSVLTDDFGPESDVDVLISFAADAPEQSLSTLADLELELSAIFRRATDLGTRASVMRSENHIRRRRILESARPLYVAG